MKLVLTFFVTFLWTPCFFFGLFWKSVWTRHVELWFSQ
jgi:hypothetical protein